MTPSEFNLFLNTPKAAHSLASGTPEIPNKNSGNIFIFFVLGITFVAVGYSLYHYIENNKLKQKTE